MSYISSFLGEKKTKIYIYHFPDYIQMQTWAPIGTAFKFINYTQTDSMTALLKSKPIFFLSLSESLASNSH